MDLSKGERLLEFFRVLSLSDPASDHDGAMALLQKLNNVEDMYSGIARRDDAALDGLTDGRLYPPNEAVSVCTLGSPRRPLLPSS